MSGDVCLADMPRLYESHKRTVAADFARTWLEFVVKRGDERPDAPIPQVGGACVDIAVLYDAVARRGGMAKVSASRGWRAITGAGGLGIPPTFPTADFTVRAIYARLLWAFEQKDLFGVDLPVTERAAAAAAAKLVIDPTDYPVIAAEGKVAVSYNSTREGRPMARPSRSGYALMARRIAQRDGGQHWAIMRALESGQREPMLHALLALSYITSDKHEKRRLSDLFGIADTIADLLDSCQVDGHAAADDGGSFGGGAASAKRAKLDGVLAAVDGSVEEAHDDAANLPLAGAVDTDGASAAGGAGGWASDRETAIDVAIGCTTVLRNAAIALDVPFATNVRVFRSLLHASAAAHPLVRFHALEALSYMARLIDMSGAVFMHAMTSTTIGTGLPRTLRTQSFKLYIEACEKVFDALCGCTASSDHDEILVGMQGLVAFMTVNANAAYIADHLPDSVVDALCDALSVSVPGTGVAPFSSAKPDALLSRLPGAAESGATSGLVAPVLSSAGSGCLDAVDRAAAAAAGAAKEPPSSPRAAALDAHRRASRSRGGASVIGADGRPLQVPGDQTGNVEDMGRPGPIASRLTPLATAPSPQVYGAPDVVGNTAQLRPPPRVQEVPAGLLTWRHAGAAAHAEARHAASAARLSDWTAAAVERRDFAVTAVFALLSPHCAALRVKFGRHPRLAERLVALLSTTVGREETPALAVECLVSLAAEDELRPPLRRLEAELTAAATSSACPVAKRVATLLPMLDE